MENEAAPKEKTGGSLMADVAVAQSFNVLEEEQVAFYHENGFLHMSRALPYR